MDMPSSLPLHPRQVQCGICGLVTRKSNSARHRKRQHPPCEELSSSLSSCCSSVAGTPGSVHGVSTSPSPVPGVVPKRVVVGEEKRLKLIIRLPAVTRALQETEEKEPEPVGGGSLYTSSKSPGRPTDHLPPTPQNDEEL